MKRISRKCRRLVKQFENAAQTLEVLGSRMPEEHQEILTIYKKAKKELYEYITDLEERQFGTPLKL